MAPSRRTTGVGPVRSITVDGTPGRGPTSTIAATAARSRARDLRRRSLGRPRPGGSRSSPPAGLPPRAPPARRRRPRAPGRRWPWRRRRRATAGVRPGSGRRGCRGRATARGGRARGASGTSLEQRVDARRDNRCRLTIGSSLQLVERIDRRFRARDDREAVDGVGRDHHHPAGAEGGYRRVDRPSSPSLDDPVVIAEITRHDDVPIPVCLELAATSATAFAVRLEHERAAGPEHVRRRVDDRGGLAPRRRVRCAAPSRRPRVRGP